MTEEMKTEDNEVGLLSFPREVNELQLECTSDGASSPKNELEKNFDSTSVTSKENIVEIETVHIKQEAQNMITIQVEKCSDDTNDIYENQKKCDFDDFKESLIQNIATECGNIVNCKWNEVRHIVLAEDDNNVENNVLILPKINEVGRDNIEEDCSWHKVISSLKEECDANIEEDDHIEQDGATNTLEDIVTEGHANISQNGVTPVSEGDGIGEDSIGQNNDVIRILKTEGDVKENDLVEEDGLINASKKEGDNGKEDDQIGQNAAAHVLEDNIMEEHANNINQNGARSALKGDDMEDDSIGQNDAIGIMKEDNDRDSEVKPVLENDVVEEHANVRENGIIHLLECDDEEEDSITRNEVIDNLEATDDCKGVNERIQKGEGVQKVGVVQSDVEDNQCGNTKDVAANGSEYDSMDEGNCENEDMILGSGDLLECNIKEECASPVNDAVVEDSTGKLPEALEDVSALEVEEHNSVEENYGYILGMDGDLLGSDNDFSTNGCDMEYSRMSVEAEEEDGAEVENSDSNTQVGGSILRAALLRGGKQTAVEHSSYRWAFQSPASKGDFSCTVCCKTFKSHTSLGIHTTVMHLRDKQFKCWQCNQCYDTVLALRRHITSHNPGSFECHICGKSFVKKYNHTRHMRSHEALFVCRICNKSFTSKRYLHDHLQRHTADKKFSCPVCEKSFSKKVYLKKHLTIHKGVSFFDI